MEQCNFFITSHLEEKCLPILLANFYDACRNYAQINYTYGIAWFFLRVLQWEMKKGIWESRNVFFFLFVFVSSFRDTFFSCFFRHVYCIYCWALEQSLIPRCREDAWLVIQIARRCFLTNSFIRASDCSCRCLCGTRGNCLYHFLRGFTLPPLAAELNDSARHLHGHASSLFCLRQRCSALWWLPRTQCNIYVQPSPPPHSLAFSYFHFPR